MKDSEPHLRPTDLFDLSFVRHAAIFKDCEFAWEAIGHLPTYTKATIHPNVGTLGNPSNPMIMRTTVVFRNEVLTEGIEIKFKEDAPTVFHEGKCLEGASIIYQGAFLKTNIIELGEGVVIDSGALIEGPTILGNGTVLRPRCYLRGAVITGENCVIGHATEVKNALFLNRAKAPHKAYVGDSILGNDTNLGAGTCLANFKERTGQELVSIKYGKDCSYPTGLRKLGAVLGDDAETGCNSVCNPGTVIGKKTVVYASISIRGYYPAGKIIKNPEDVVIREPRGYPAGETKVVGGE